MGVMIKILGVPDFYSPDQEEVWGQPDPDSENPCLLLHPDQISRENRAVLNGLKVFATILPQGKLLIENKKGGEKKRKTRFIDGHSGYLVTKKAIIEALREKSVEAAEWWEDNWLNEWFSFGAEEAVVTNNLL